MRKILKTVVLSTVALSAGLGGAAARAADDRAYLDPPLTPERSMTTERLGNPGAITQPGTRPGTQPGTLGQPGTVGQPGAIELPLTTVGKAKDLGTGQLRHEIVGIKPQIGALMFKDQQLNASSRAIQGVTVDGNLATMINKDWNTLFVGPSVGVLYSHLGDPTSNFIGTNPTSQMGAGGANLLLLPANLKLGLNLADNFRIAAHGGGNLVYRSMASSMNLGDSALGSDSAWKLFPNVGADAEFGLGNNVALMLRPDWTVTPGDTLFSGTVALNIPLT